jgi:hypothetical protein
MAAATAGTSVDSRSVCWCIAEAQLTCFGIIIDAPGRYDVFRIRYDAKGPTGRGLYLATPVE